MKNEMEYRAPTTLQEAKRELESLYYMHAGALDDLEPLRMLARHSPACHRDGGSVTFDFADPTHAVRFLGLMTVYADRAKGVNR